MIDIVIPLGTGSIDNGHGNLEIKYCLLTIKKYLTGYRNIYIIGEHPGIEGDFIHIPAKDSPMGCKEENIRRKIEVACNHPDISEDFFFGNDDYGYLKSLDIITLPYYYEGDLQTAYNKKRKIGCYKSAIENTLNKLTEHGKPVKHFDIHVPIIYNKKKFLDVMNQMWEWTKCGYIIKSLYCNTLEIEGEPLNDMMIGWGLNHASDVYDHIKDRFVFAYNESGINAALLQVLNEISS